MIKILHTADWHLGVKLHKKDLTEDHFLFFSWLIHLIKESKIDVLLISGDVFDYANPTAEAKNLYFSFLKQLIDVKCKVIITGGNHDSPAVLNGPQEILKMLDVHIIGNVPGEIHEQIICIKNKLGETEALVCAAPFLRDPEIRLAVEGETYEQRWQQRKAGMKKHFQKLSDVCAEKYDKVPVILMAHLFASGAELSEQKRDITVGGLESFVATDFPHGCNYVALGHIHRPQMINGNEYIRYSGAPVALSFSERAQQKMVIELEIENANISSIHEHNVPIFRHLAHFTGTLQQVTQQLVDYKNEKTLIAFGNLEIIEPTGDIQLGLKVHQLVTSFASVHIEILNYKYNAVNHLSGIDALFTQSTEVETLEPLDVLRKKLQVETISEDQQALIEEAFTEILKMVEDENS